MRELPQRKIGDVAVGAIGLGTMPLSVRGRPARADAIRTILAALDAGVTLVDTADAYSLGGSDTGHGELLVAEALAEWDGDKSSVLVATKGGHIQSEQGVWDVDSRPEYLRGAAEASLRRLGVDTIGLYQHHRPDPKVPYEEAIGTIRELHDEGKVRLVGISNANVEQIDMAIEILGPGVLASVQNEYSLSFRSSEGELQHAGHQGVAFLPWSPFGGAARFRQLGECYPAVARIAASRGVSAYQVVLAWMLAKGSHVIPIPGASRKATILDSIGACFLELDDAELDDIDGA
jgi:aryl-alcohol dehydrogenase-like predicted oxidoreductase